MPGVSMLTDYSAQQQGFFLPDRTLAALIGTIASAIELIGQTT